MINIPTVTFLQCQKKIHVKRFKKNPNLEEKLLKCSFFKNFICVNIDKTRPKNTLPIGKTNERRKEGNICTHEFRIPNLCIKYLQNPINYVVRGPFLFNNFWINCASSSLNHFEKKNYKKRVFPEICDCHGIQIYFYNNYCQFSDFMELKN